jgi:hypothetical protein
MRLTPIGQVHRSAQRGSGDIRYNWVTGGVSLGAPRTVTVTIELTEEQETRLAALARRRGLEPAEMAQRLVVEHLPPDKLGEEQARRESVMRELVAETERLGLYD